MSFTISKANGLSFKINTTAGSSSQNAGTSLPDNYLWNEIQTFYNCTRINNEARGDVCQKYLSNDIVYFQASSDQTIFVEAQTDEGVFVEAIAELASPPWARQTYLIDFASGNFTSPGCYQIKVYTGGTNLFTMADDGTCEANVNNVESGQDLVQPDNTHVQSAAQAQAGTNSCLITASPAGVPNANHRLVFANAGASPITLEAGARYKASAWVYVDSGNPFVGAGNINLTAIHDNTFGTPAAPFIEGWTGSTVLSSSTMAATTTDVWTEITTEFVCGSTTSGHLCITSDNVPTAGGILYVDTVTLTKMNTTEEACSQVICIRDSHPCTQLLQWSNNADQFGVDYSNSLTFSARIELAYHQASWEQEDFNVSSDASNFATREIFAPFQIQNLVTGPLPYYDQVKLLIALGHSTFQINNVAYVLFQNNITVEYPDEFSGLGIIRAQIRLADFDYQGGEC